MRGKIHGPACARYGAATLRLEKATKAKEAAEAEYDAAFKDALNAKKDLDELVEKTRENS